MISALAAGAVMLATLGALSAPMIHQGASCTMGPYRAVPVGAVLPSVSEPDRGGASGNEVNDVYRVFFVTTRLARPLSGFAGWLSSSFDGRYAFTPAGLMQPNGVPMSLTVRPGDPGHLALGAWLSTLAANHSVYDPSLDVVVSGEPVATTVAPCFASAWDGSPAR